MSPRRVDVAALLVGETLLVPHLLPIIDALVTLRPDYHIDLWVGDARVERLVRERARWSGDGVRIRRTPDYDRSTSGKLGKLVRLARLLPAIKHARAVLCAEQTTLWLPLALPLRARFVNTQHGSGSVGSRQGPRRRAAWRTLVSGPLERDAYLALGFPPEKLSTIGYIKTSFPPGPPIDHLFAERRPVVLYTPHWQQHRSSWWAWGRQVVAMLAAQSDFNVVLAPHQRLAERDPGVRSVLAAVADLPHVHVDLESEAMIDGTYLAAADIYLGDTSSQVVEFLARPRPCVFLNPLDLDWRATDDHLFWNAGEVVTDLDQVSAALARAPALHPEHLSFQREFVAGALGDTGPGAPLAAARIVIEAVGR